MRKRASPLARWVAWVASGVVARLARGEANDEWGKGFSSWIAAFEFALPNQTFTIAYAKVEVELTSMRCANTRIGWLNSRADAGESEIAIDMSDVSFDCALTWIVRDYYGYHAMGDARARAERSSASGAVALILDGNVDDETTPRLPREIRLTTCVMHLIVQELTFSGGRFASVLNAASPAIRAELGRTLSSSACAGIKSGLDKYSGVESTWENSTLARDERALAPLFTPVEPLPFPSYVDAVDLKANALRRWASFMVQTYVSASRGPRSFSAFARWLEDQNEHNHAYNAKVVQVPPVWLVDSDTKLPKISISPPSDVLRTVSSTIQDVRFVVYEMKILGLETASELRGPDVEVTTNTTIPITSVDFGFGWDRVALNVSGVLDVLPADIALDPWLEPLTVSFGLEKPQLNITLGLAIDAQAISALRGSQATNVACIAATIMQINVRAIDWSGAPDAVIITPWRIGRFANASDDTLEASIDGFIAETSKLITETLSEAVQCAVSHQIGTAVRNATDKALRRRLNELQKANCPAITTTFRRLNAFKLGLSTTLLYCAAICGFLFALVLFGYSSVVVGAWKFMKSCFHDCFHRRALGDVNESDDDADDVNVSTPVAATPQSTRRTYSRAMFNSALRGDDVTAVEDDMSMITDSLLGDAEVDDEGNIDVAATSLSHRQPALYKSSVVPKSAKYGLPMLYTMTFMLFFASNLRVGATVNVRAWMSSPENGDTDFIIRDIFIFGLEDTVVNMWRAGVYVLSALILLFSGVWPYVKLILLYRAWLSPAFDSAKARGALLRNLDALGKWSLLDAFVMTLFMVLFHFEVSSDDGQGSLTVSVDPKPGFFIFLLATCSSMVLGHATTAYHALDEREKYIYTKPASESEDEGDDERRVLDVEHSIRQNERPTLIWMRARGDIVSSKDLALQLTLGVLGSILIISTLVTLIIGIRTVAIQINFLGVAGAALGEDASSVELSLVSLATAIPPCAHRRIVQATLLVFAFGVPLLRIALLGFLWITPLTRRRRRVLWHYKAVVDCWSALDVLLVAFLAAMLQIRQFLAFMLGGNCDALNHTLQQLVEGPVNGGQNLCFDVVASVQRGCWLFGVAIVGSIASSALLSAAHRIDAQKENENADSRCSI